MRLFKLFVIIICLLPSACLVGPDYEEPLTQAEEHWLTQPLLVNEAPFSQLLWWESFHDPVLTDLIHEGYVNNLSLQVAGVRVLQARAQLAQSVGNLYPQQQALLGNYTYNRIGGTSLQDVLPPSFLTAMMGFTANWELDFWGKYRRAIQANDATFLASLAAYDFALVTLTADLALSYIKIRTFETKIKVTEANIKVQTIGLKIARARFNAGQTSLVDVEQASTELSQTQASLPPLFSDLQRQKDALAVLLGTIPSEVDHPLQQGRGIPIAPAEVAVGIPKEALIRRPDIYQARLEAITQCASVGAIAATLYPSFALNGTFAFASNNINNASVSDLFHWANRTITAGPTFNWPILNYGQITNAVRAQDAVYQQALLKYMNQVLKAQQEVQDNISDFIGAKESEHFLSQANDSATKSLKLALVRYKEGETDFTPVLNAEQQQLKVQMSLASAQGHIPEALVNLYRALGGGWELRNGQELVPGPIKAAMAERTHWGSLLKQDNHLAPESKYQLIKQLYLPTW